MWSSCPCVSTTASMSSSRSRIGSKSGRIRSTPGWFSSGNSTPQSMIEQPAVVLEHGHVAPDLAEPAERDRPAARAAEVAAARRARGAGGSYGDVLQDVGERRSSSTQQVDLLRARRLAVCGCAVRRGWAARRASSSAALAITAPWCPGHDRRDERQQRSCRSGGRSARSPASRAAIIAAYCAPGDVADHGDDADRAEGEPGEVQRVVAAVDRQVGRAQQPGAGVQVAACFLDRDDPRVLGDRASVSARSA